MFHYPQVPPFDHQAVHLPYLPRLRSWKPSVKFCPAFARGFCQAEEQCTLYHISLKEIHCKFDQKGTCKFGSDCYFKHSPKRQKEQSDLTPIIQHIARENLELVQRVEKAELRIGALENELARLKALHEAPHSKPAKPQAKQQQQKTQVVKTPTEKFAKLKWEGTRKQSSTPGATLKCPPSPVPKRTPELRVQTLHSNERRKLPTQTSSRSLNQLQIHANPQFCSDNPWSILASNEEDFQEPAKTHLFIQQCNERRTPTLSGSRTNPPFLSLKSPEKARQKRKLGVKWHPSSPWAIPIESNLCAQTKALHDKMEQMELFMISEFRQLRKHDFDKDFYTSETTYTQT